MKSKEVEQNMLKLISTIDNTALTYCNHENPDLLGEDISVSENLLHDELIRFHEIL